MDHSKVIIAVVVTIVVVKLIAVHLYLRTKINQSDTQKDQSSKDG
ncbi:MAG TPA: hypothetical protein PK055_10255 [Gammaproteobacteria bacterium]|nr:hypothetical protein [Gammaproteobacteria bacterium]HPQ88028.1 hypothetical protein [Gammaproteobacteria bacterium]